MEERIDAIRPVRPKIGPGFRVGHLTVKEATDGRKNGYTIWRCRCDCGNEALVDTRYLQRGTMTDCGCMKRLAPRTRDIAGQRFGRLVAIEPTDERRYSGSVVWRCRCDCGNEALVPARQLITGYVRSCGCLSHPPVKDYIGKRFGRLTVTGYDGKRDGKHYWQCRCDCGGEVVVSQPTLQEGKTKSCGCLNREQLAKTLGLVDGTSIKLLEHFQKHLSTRNTSGYNGVYRNRKTGKWQAQISMAGKTKSLGSFGSKNKAISARHKVDIQIAAYLRQYYADHPEWKRPVDD